MIIYNPGVRNFNQLIGNATLTQLPQGLINLAIIGQGVGNPPVYGTPVVDVGEGHITIFPTGFISIQQGTWDWVVIAAAELFGKVFTNTSFASGDKISYYVYLQAGTYTLKIIYDKGSMFGILKCFINNVLVGSVDEYAAAYTEENIWTVSGINIPASGLFVLYFITNSKNASSSGFAVTYKVISLFRTA